MAEKDFETNGVPTPENTEAPISDGAQLPENTEATAMPESTETTVLSNAASSDSSVPETESVPQHDFVAEYNASRAESHNSEGDAPKTASAENMGTAPNSYGGFSQKWNYERAETRSKKNTGLKVFAGVMAFLFIASASSFATYFYFDKKSEKESEPPEEAISSSLDISDTIGEKVTNAAVTPIPDIKGEYTGKELTSQEVIELATPSVVGIKTLIEQNYGYFYGTQTYSGVGSGFIITDDGYVVTNYHVIEDAVSIKVILSDNTEYDAETVGFDELSDVAVLKINADVKLPALVIGNSDAVVAGDTVIAIGSPSGIDLAGTATRGMVSKVNREISITDYYGRVQKKMSVIQIDAAINPGNSGGPLLNSRGEVIGINTLKLSSTTYEGIGFALPINGVMKLVDQICANGAVIERPADSFVTGKAALGIQYQDITEAYSRKYQLPEGVLVVLAARGGAAYNAGIKSGDIIVEFDGKETKSAEELMAIISSHKPGDKVSARIHRDGEYKELEVTLTEASE